MNTGELLIASPSSWRWFGVVLLLGLGGAFGALFLEEVEPPTEILHSQTAKQSGPTVMATLPEIEVKSIQASPFQSQLIAMLNINGITQRVLPGQQLTHELSVNSIDLYGVELLYRTQKYRYELKSAASKVKHGDQDQRTLQASINLLSHEFHTTSEGIEVYSATQQGLSASLGLQNGDKISKINGEVVRQPEDILRLLKDYQPKQVLEFVGTRQGQVTTWVYQAQADD